MKRYFPVYVGSTIDPPIGYTGITLPDEHGECGDPKPEEMGGYIMQLREVAERIPGFISKERWDSFLKKGGDIK